MAQPRNFLNYRIDFLTETYTRSGLSERSRWRESDVFFFRSIKLQLSIVSFNFIPILIIFIHWIFPETKVLFVFFFTHFVLFCFIVHMLHFLKCDAIKKCKSLMFSSSKLDFYWAHSLNDAEWNSPSSSKAIDRHRYRNIHTHTNIRAIWCQFPWVKTYEEFDFIVALFSASLFSILECTFSIVTTKEFFFFATKYGCDIVLFISDTF